MGRLSSTLTSARRTALCGLLLRAARDGRLDLGGHDLPNWAAIDGLLLEADVSVDDLSAIGRADIDAIRACLDLGPSVRERLEGAIEWLDESGIVSALLIALIVLALLWLWRAMLTSAQAAGTAVGPEPSNVAGLLVASVPFVVIMLLLAAASRGQPRPADEEAFGDTTGFGEREQ